MSYLLAPRLRESILTFPMWALHFQSNSVVSPVWKTHFISHNQQISACFFSFTDKPVIMYNEYKSQPITQKKKKKKKSVTKM